MANGTLAASQIEMESLSGTGVTTITPPATNTNRAITLPDAAGEVVLNSATQTLTNKTIQGGVLTRATAVTASGTSVDFTDIPSWVKRITVMMIDTSTNGTSNYLLRIGDASGVSSSGYSGFTKRVAGTTLTTSTITTNGYLATTLTAAAQTVNGSITITNVTGNLWLIQGSIMASNDDLFLSVSRNTLSGVLTQVRVTTVNGTDTFDAGTINIMYEG
jgi:hypothetical protein